MADKTNTIYSIYSIYIMKNRLHEITPHDNDYINNGEYAAIYLL